MQCSNSYQSLAVPAGPLPNWISPFWQESGSRSEKSKFIPGQTSKIKAKTIKQQEELRSLAPLLWRGAGQGRRFAVCHFSQPRRSYPRTAAGAHGPRGGGQATATALDVPTRRRRRGREGCGVFSQHCWDRRIPHTQVRGRVSFWSLKVLGCACVCVHGRGDTGHRTHLTWLGPSHREAGLSKSWILSDLLRCNLRKSLCIYILW